MTDEQAGTPAPPNGEAALVAQVIQQCRAVAHMARCLADLHEDRAKMFADGFVLGLVEMTGARSASIMEQLGDTLNAMDALDEDEDGWMQPVFREAQRLWPADGTGSYPSPPLNADEIPGTEES